MKRHYRRHLLCEAAVTRPSDELADGGHICECLKGADETSLSSAPSVRGCCDKAVRGACGRGPTAAITLWAAFARGFNAQNQYAHNKSQRIVDKKFFPGLQTYMRIPAEFLLTRNALSRGFAPGGRTSLLAYEKGRRISLRIRNSYSRKSPK